MVNLASLLAVFLAVATILLVLVWEPRSRRRVQTSKRLTRQEHIDDSPFSKEKIGFANRLVSVRFMAGDYAEIRQFLGYIGMDKARIPVFYALVCWGLPLSVLILVGIFDSWLFAFVGAVFIFVLTRRSIRSHAKTIDMRLNSEAVELCYLMRMFMESGISLERSMRLVSGQAGTMIPTLMRYVHRFNRMLDAGESRQAALLALGSNKEVPVLRDLALLLRQTSQLGAASSEGLDNIIRQAQAKEHSRLQETTNKVGAKMSMVMVGCMLPALMILIGGPALHSLSAVFQ